MRLLLVVGQRETERPVLTRELGCLDGEDFRGPSVRLNQVTLVDRDAITFLAQCEAAAAAWKTAVYTSATGSPETERKPRTRERNTPTRRNPGADDPYARGDRNVITTGSTTEHGRQ
jgi:hypothetical protein